MDHNHIFKILTTQIYVLDISPFHERSEKTKLHSFLYLIPIQKGFYW